MKMYMVRENVINCTSSKFKGISLQTFCQLDVKRTADLIQTFDKDLIARMQVEAEKHTVQNRTYTGTHTVHPHIHMQ